MPQLGTLAFVILGLLNETPMSGYDVRRLFRDTPLKSYSDSPGSTYPALRALEARRFIVGRADSSTERGKRIHRVTAAGRAALLSWLRDPVPAGDPGSAGVFEAKLAFMSDLLPAEESVALTREYMRAVEQQLELVGAYASDHSSELPLSARLALEGGIAKLEATLSWLGSVVQQLRTK